MLKSHADIIEIKGFFKYFIVLHLTNEFHYENYFFRIYTTFPLIKGRKKRTCMKI